MASLPTSKYSPPASSSSPFPTMRLLGLPLLLFMAVYAAHAEDVASGLQDLKYKIDFHPAEAPVLPTSDQETIVMTDKDGKQFRCNIPMLESTKKDGFQHNDTSTNSVAEELAPRKTPEDLLDAFKDKCFRRYEGWWIYELCYKGQLRQFHLHDKKAPISTYGPDMQHGSVVYFFTLVKQPSNVPHDFRTHRKTIVQEFVLGKYDAEATAALHDHSSNFTLEEDNHSQNAAQRYHAHVYTNGTICDLTNQPRETEVRFVCSETGRPLINSIKEAPSCKYTVVFHAPMLCKHPDFQEDRQPWVVIDCNAVPSDAKQEDPLPVLGVSTKFKDDIQVMKLREDSSEGNKSHGAVEENEAKVEPVALVEKPTTTAQGDESGEGIAEEVAAPVDECEVKGEEKSEEKSEELALPGHRREEHPTT